MGDTGALTKAITDLTTAVNALVAAIGTSSLDQPAIDAATAQVEALTQTVTAATPTPAPAPAPAAADPTATATVDGGTS